MVLAIFLGAKNGFPPEERLLIDCVGRLLVTQGFDRIHFGGTHGGVDAEEDADYE